MHSIATLPRPTDSKKVLNAIMHLARLRMWFSCPSRTSLSTRGPAIGSNSCEANALGVSRLHCLTTHYNATSCRTAESILSCCKRYKRGASAPPTAWTCAISPTNCLTLRMRAVLSYSEIVVAAQKGRNKPTDVSKYSSAPAAARSKPAIPLVAKQRISRASPNSSDLDSASLD